MSHVAVLAADTRGGINTKSFPVIQSQTRVGIVTVHTYEPTESLDNNQLVALITVVRFMTPGFSGVGGYVI